MNVVLDTEVYHNYFLATFVFESGKIIEFEKHDERVTMGNLSPVVTELMREGHTLVTFNGKRYDLPILSLALNGASNHILKEASDKIILEEQMWWQIESHYNFNILQIDHIDIINLLPLFESLKMYGARAGYHRIQDLPFEPDTTIDTRMARELREYCRDDCMNTWGRFVDLWPEIELRIKLGEEYDLDLRSKSDAQIAENVMMSEYKKMTNQPLVKPIDKGGLPQSVMYFAPNWVKFETENLQSLYRNLNGERYELSHKSGKPLTPDWMKKLTVEIDGRSYAVGLGGLHSQNKRESWFKSDRGTRVVDLDVASYYPSIIINEGYEPPHMKGVFREIYQSLVIQRLAAKANGDKVTADTLKITINGTFGKLGSRFSAVYAPQLLLAVTFTGQLALLMLIERAAQRGIQCVSANTDGVTFVLPPEVPSGALSQVVHEWEMLTGFVMDYTYYSSYHARDVNNYFAVTTDGKVKTKGIFAAPSVRKNPAAPITVMAAMDFVLNCESIERTIYRCADITKFLSVKKVAGGGHKDGEYLGKVVRWYYSTETDTAIHYVSNGNKVGKSEGAMPMMEITDIIPHDLDYQWYIDEAYDIVKQVGYFPWM